MVIMPLQRIAENFVGQKEIPSNRGFADKDFEKLMLRTGWRAPQAWCAWFVKMCIWFAHEKWGDHFADLVSPSAVQTWNNYKRAGRTTQTPEPGMLCVWQNYVRGVAQSTGHIGIVADPRPVQGAEVNVFHSIEGNTNEDGSRDGDGVALKLRKLDFKKRTNGLVLLGFCKTSIE